MISQQSQGEQKNQAARDRFAYEERKEQRRLDNEARQVLLDAQAQI